MGEGNLILVQLDHIGDATLVKRCGELVCPCNCIVKPIAATSNNAASSPHRINKQKRTCCKHDVDESNLLLEDGGGMHCT